MPKNPTVSIIIPIYNGEKYLTESLISVLYQTYSAIEIIAVNDGSTDRSLEILQHLQKSDNRIVIIDQKNGGIVSALNAGIAQAKGKYIARMDADDISFIDRIEKQVQVLEADHKKRVALVTGGFEVIDENSEFMYREILPTESVDIKRLLYVQNCIAHGSVMFRKDTFNKLGGYSANCGPTEDYELWTRMAAEGKFVALEDLIYRWRQNRRGITFTNNDAMQKHAMTINKLYWNTIPPKIVSRKNLKERGRFYISSANKYGHDMKNIYYYNLAQMSARLFSAGRRKEGISQFIALITADRLGLRTGLKRVAVIVKTSTRAFLNRT